MAAARCVRGKARRATPVCARRVGARTCALLLAVTGLGGMMAFTVSQRLREIGVRLALGARPPHIVRAIARQFTIPVVCGALAGSGLAAAAGMVLSRELFGVSGLDPLAHGGALLLFVLVAAVAAIPSMRRALRVDPIECFATSDDHRGSWPTSPSTPSKSLPSYCGGARMCKHATNVDMFQAPASRLVAPKMLIASSLHICSSRNVLCVASPGA